MRRPLVVGNWKMHLAPDEARALIATLRPRLDDASVETAVAPAAPVLAAAAEALAGSAIRLCAQNMHAEAAGAFTGETAPGMLTALGVRMVILGHSERRTLFGETDAGVAAKTAAAQRHGLCPIVCIGETAEQRDANETAAIVAGQLGLALDGLEDPRAPLVVAYEPVWAIGTGRVATPEQVDEVHGLLRGLLVRRLGAPGEAVRILYGGSVKPDNAAELLALEDVDGALVGGASLTAEAFVPIVEAAL